MPIPPIEEFELLHTHICQAVGDPKRIQLLYALHEQPRNVNDLARLLDTPQPTVSRHLAVLRQRAIVLTRREGTSVTYRLADPRIIDILNMMRDLLRGVLDRQTQPFTEGAAD